MCYTTWSAGEEWLGWGRQLKEPGQYSEECLGMAGLRQTFLRLVNRWRQVLWSLGRQWWEDSNRIREKELNTLAEAGGFFRNTGCQKVLEERKEAFSFISQYLLKD